MLPALTVMELLPIGDAATLLVESIRIRGRNGSDRSMTATCGRVLNLGFNACRPRPKHSGLAVLPLLREAYVAFWEQRRPQLHIVFKTVENDMYRRRSLGIAALLMGLCCAGIAYATDPAHRPDPAKVTPTAGFVQEAVVGNLFEVESSKLALDRSQNATIKTFAKLMVDDHSAAGVKLADAISEAKQPRPPLKLDAKRQTLLDGLAARKGKDFDKFFVETQHKAHVEAVALFESYAATGEDARLKALAGELLPTLKGHLMRIEKIEAAWK